MLSTNKLHHIPYLGYGWSSASTSTSTATTTTVQSDNQLQAGTSSDHLDQVAIKQEQAEAAQLSDRDRLDTNLAIDIKKEGEAGRKRSRQEFERDEHDTKANKTEEDNFGGTAPTKASQVQPSLCSPVASKLAMNANTIRFPAVSNTTYATPAAQPQRLSNPVAFFSDTTTCLNQLAPQQPVQLQSEPPPQPTQPPMQQPLTGDFDALVQLLCDSVTQQTPQNVSNQNQLENLANFLLSQQSQIASIPNQSITSSTNCNIALPSSSDTPQHALMATNNAQNVPGSMLNNYGNIINNNYQIVNNNHNQTSNGQTAGIPPLIEAVCDGPNCARKTRENGLSLLICGRCLNARYCSQSCQYANSTEHSKLCDFFYQARKTLNLL